MSPNVLLVAAAVITSTITVLFLLWTLVAYLEFRRDRESTMLVMKRFAAIRAGAVDTSGGSLPPDELTEEDLVKLLLEIRGANLADVPKEWVNRIGRLAKRETAEA